MTLFAKHLLTFIVSALVGVSATAAIVIPKMNKTIVLAHDTIAKQSLTLANDQIANKAGSEAQQKRGATQPH
jgi:hypothetical protein